MEKQKIYLPLQGRIGNQLFQYAFARRIQLEMSEGAEIIIDDSDVLRCGWENSLPFYRLPKVRYIHKNIIENQNRFSKQYLLRKIYRGLVRKKDYISKYKREKELQGFLNKQGLFLCENGYIEPHLNYTNPIYLEGYFQSEKYFKNVRDDILRLLDGRQFEQLRMYPGLDKLIDRNSVCISVKVEHNVGSSMYSVCSMEYWKKAIQYIIENVEDPLFFICSDNVPFVLEHLIDARKYEYILQEKSMPIHVSLAAMAECKNFIIGNTTFGWWAQYLSRGRDKIVIAPSRWMAIDMPIDIYQDSWHLITL